MIQIPVILLALGLAAALVNPEAPKPPPPEAAQTEQPEITVNELAAPARVTATLPENLLDAGQAAEITLDYTPGDEKTWYFTANSSPVDKASAGGYYRKALGSTRDGGQVVQDYYQDSGKPQTAPFILKTGSDPHDFNSDNAASKTVWYRKDGSVEAVQDYRDGSPYGRLNIYQEGRLVAQMPLDDSRSDTPDDPYHGEAITNGLRLYYPGGKLMGYIRLDDDGRAELYYREDGSPISAGLYAPDGALREINNWDTDGNHIADGSVADELHAIHERKRAILDTISHLGFIADESDTAPPPAALPAPEPQPGLLPESVLDAKQATNHALDYTPEADGQTWYFDRDSNPAETASPGGYYRKALGKTADGRLVAQDYYQDSNTPQTAPFILVKDANPHDFSNDTVDSRVIWYRPDGSTYAVQTFQNGKPTSRMNHYHDGRLIAQMPRPQNMDEADDPYRSAGDLADGLRLYHPSGHLLYLNQHYANQNDEILYDNDGTPLAAYRERQGEAPAIWSVLDEHPEKRGAVAEALARREHIENLMRDEAEAEPEATPSEESAPPAAPEAKPAAEPPPAPAAKPEESEPAVPAAQPATEPPPPPADKGEVSPQTTTTPNDDSHHPDPKNNPGDTNLPTTTVQPDTLGAPAPQTARLPAAVLDAKQAAENPIDYTPAAEADQYADRDGKPSEQPSPGGFIRKTLGKTADGRLVVQDYYQDSNTPQTAPLTLKKDADPRDFTTNAVDGKVVWYTVEGDILAIQQYQNGEAISPLRYYREGRLSEQSEPPASAKDATPPADGDKAPSATPDSQPAPSAATPTTHNHTGDDNVALLLQEPAAHPDSKYNLHPRIWMSAGIEPDSMAAPPALPALPASEYDAAEAAKTDITYTPYPQAEKTYTRDSSYSTRKILGETADGRLVIQDYYANSDQPRTAPYILNKYGDKQDAGTIHADSKLVWYRQDGSVYAVQRYHAGHPAGHLSYYQNGRLIAQHASDVPDTYSIAGKVASGTRYYYDDGHILALEYHQGRVLGCGMTGYCEEAESLYAPDGSPLAAWHGEQTNDIVSIRSWNSLNTTPAAEQAARRKTFDAALTRWEEIKQDLNGQDINSYYESPNAETREPSQPDIAAALLPDTLAASADLPAPTLAENVLDAKQAAENPIDYTPAAEADQYADRDGKPSEQPSPGGFIRKTLGKTADGRLVVQDYYQDSNTPQTAPFTLKKDADPRDYTTGAVDGKITWYRPDGSILAIQQYRNGAPISRLNHYRNGRLNHYRSGRLASQSELPAGISEPDDPYSSAGEASQGRRYYYENGQLLALESGNNNPWTCEKQGCEGWAILYDENGQPLAAYHGERSNDTVSPKHWNTLNHTPADEHTARRQTFDAALQRLHELQQMRQQDGL